VTSSPPFALDPGIDADALRAAYEERGHVQISPFLAGAGAERLLEHLRARQDWVVAAQPGGSRIVEFDRAAFEALPPVQREAIHKLAAPREMSGFRYFFERIAAVTEPGAEREAGTLLSAFHDFLTSAPVMHLMRRITGAADIDFADAHASAYGAGHFLTLHNDNARDRGRRAAYVLGLTPEWRPEWGGLLLFHDENGDVMRGLLPRMNVLNLFRVPLDHSVSGVVPFAPERRFAVTGWLRAISRPGEA
jgi:hypothetical protein